MRSVTSQGSAHGRFERALRSGQVFHAELAAREMGNVTLGDALRLVVLYASTDTGKFGKAAARWLARFVVEARLDLLEAQLGLSALMLLSGPERARGAGLLVELGRRHRVNLSGAFQAAPRT